MQNKVLLCSALLSRSDYLAFSKNTLPSLQKVAAFASKSSTFYPLRRLFFGSAVRRFLIFSLHHKIYSFVLFSFQGTMRNVLHFTGKYLHKYFFTKRNPATNISRFVFKFLTFRP